MAKLRGVPGFWLDIDALESARTQLIGRLGRKDGMMAYAIHIRCFTWQYRTARPVLDDAHVARLTGLDIRSCRRLWPEVREEIGWIFDVRSNGSYCKRTAYVLNNFNKNKILSGAGTTSTNRKDSDLDPDLKNLVPQEGYIPAGQETDGLALEFALLGEEEQNETKRLPEERRDRCPAEAIMALYNQTLVPPLREAVNLSTGRRGHIQALWGNGMGDMETWQSYFAYVAESRFLTGQVDAGHGRSGPFRADLDWLIKPSNELKIREGKYHGE